MDNYKDKGNKSISKLERIDTIDIPTVKVAFPQKKIGKKKSLIS